MKRTLTRADADAIRADIDAQRGCPRTHVVGDGELVRVGGGIHVEVIRTETAVSIEGDADEGIVTIDDVDEKHVEPSRRARLRAAQEPVEGRRGPEERGPKGKP